MQFGETRISAYAVIKGLLALAVLLWLSLGAPSRRRAILLGLVGFIGSVAFSRAMERKSSPSSTTWSRAMVVIPQTSGATATTSRE